MSTLYAVHFVYYWLAAIYARCMFLCIKLYVLCKVLRQHNIGLRLGKLQYIVGVCTEIWFAFARYIGNSLAYSSCFEYIVLTQ